MKNIAIKWCLGLTLLLSLPSCGSSITRSALVGAYVADYPAATEKLVLLSNGKFVQQVTLKSSSQVIKAGGDWTFDAKDDRVTFHRDFLNVLDGFGKPRAYPEQGTTNLPVTRWLGNIQIGEEPSIEYKKQATKSLQAS